MDDPKILKQLRLSQESLDRINGTNRQVASVLQSISSITVPPRLDTRLSGGIK